MKQVDLFIETKHLYTMAGEGVGYKENKVIVVDNGIILDIVDKETAATAYHPAKVIDAKIKWFCPDLWMDICTPATVSSVALLRILNKTLG